MNPRVWSQLQKVSPWRAALLFVAGVLVLAFALVGCSGNGAAPSNEDGPDAVADPTSVAALTMAPADTTSIAMFRGNAGRTGEYLDPGPSGTPAELWNFVPDERVSLGEPAILNGIAFVGSLRHFLFAIDTSSGEELWRFEAPEEYISPTAAYEGRVFFVSSKYPDSSEGRSGHVYSLNAANGQIVWSVSSPDYWSYSPPAIFQDTLYLGTRAGRILAIDAESGQERWQHEVGESVIDSVAGGGGMVFAALERDYYARQGEYADSPPDVVVALDAETGEELWRSDFSDCRGDLHSVVFSDGSVFVPAECRGVPTVYALDSGTGSRQWQYTSSLQGEDLMPLTVTEDLAIVTFEDDDDKQHLLVLGAATGELRWQYDGPVGGVGLSSVSRNIVYFVLSTDTSWLHAFNLVSGAELWSYELDVAEPGFAVVSGGAIYIGHNEGLLALGSGQVGSSP